MFSMCMWEITHAEKQLYNIRKTLSFGKNIKEGYYEILSLFYHNCIFRTIANTIPIDREQCSDPSRTAFCLIANTIPEHPEPRNTNY